MTQTPPDPPESLIAYQLRLMNEKWSSIERKLDDLPEKYVSRREWQTRNDVVNDRFTRHGREIGKLEERLNGAASHTRSNLAIIISAIVGLAAVGGFIANYL